MTDLCNGDYIFQIDADEIPNKEPIENLPQILEMNSVDVILVPRVNLVDGLTDEYIKKWNWNVDDKGRVIGQTLNGECIRNPNPFVG